MAAADRASVGGSIKLEKIGKSDTISSLAMEWESDKSKPDPFSSAASEEDADERADQSGPQAGHGLDADDTAHGLAADPSATRAGARAGRVCGRSGNSAELNSEGNNRRQRDTVSRCGAW